MLFDCNGSMTKLSILPRALVHILIMHADGQGIFAVSATASVTMLQTAS